MSTPQFSVEELVAAYMLHRTFVGDELMEKMVECGLSEAARSLSTEEIKQLLDERWE